MPLGSGSCCEQRKHSGQARRPRRWKSCGNAPAVPPTLATGTPLPAQTRSLEGVTQTWKQNWQFKSTLKDGSRKLAPISHLQASTLGVLLHGGNGWPALPGRAESALHTPQGLGSSGDSQKRSLGTPTPAHLQGKLKCRLDGSRGHTGPHRGPENLGGSLQEPHRRLARLVLGPF